MSSGAADFAQLRWQSVRDCENFRTTMNRALSRFNEIYLRGSEFGWAHERLRVGGRLVGQLAYFRDPAAWFGGPLTLAWIDRVREHDEALSMIQEALAQHATALDESAVLEVSSKDPELAAVVAQAGFGVAAVGLGGRVSDAAQRLRVPRPDPLKDAGAVVTPLQRHHVTAVVDLMRATFEAHPEWCWFGAYPVHLERVADHLARLPPGHFVVLKHNELIGYISCDSVTDDALWGPHGTPELILTPPWRGRGLARSLYHYLLSNLKIRGVPALRGFTAQPSVLALGAEMGRPRDALIMHRAPGLPLALALPER